MIKYQNCSPLDSFNGHLMKYMYKYGVKNLHKGGGSTTANRRYSKVG